MCGSGGVDPDILDLIPSQRMYDMPAHIDVVLANGRPPRRSPSETNGLTSGESNIRARSAARTRTVERPPHPLKTGLRHITPRPWPRQQRPEWRPGRVGAVCEYRDTVPAIFAADIPGTDHRSA